MFPSYASEMKQICRNMDNESIKNLAKTCYTYHLPEHIELSENQTVTFMYETAEKTSMCIPKIKKYTNCNLIINDRYRHCEFLSKAPELYVKMLTK